jgi:hypothetical protein
MAAGYEKLLAIGRPVGPSKCIGAKLRDLPARLSVQRLHPEIVFIVVAGDAVCQRLPVSSKYSCIMDISERIRVEDLYRRFP